MRLTQVMAGARHGGAELFFERLASGFAKRGMDQQVICRPWPERCRNLAGLGRAVHFLPMAGRFDLLSRWRLRQLISHHDSEAVLTWMNRASIMLSPGERPFGVMNKRVHLARLGGYYKLKNYHHADWLIANTRGIADWLVAEGWPASRLSVQANFVLSPAAGCIPAKRSAMATPQGAPLLFAMGRLHPNKGFDTLINAVAAVPETWLWIAGDGPERQALEDLAESLGVAQRVRFLGWQDAVHPLLLAADVFVCPSRHEPFGNVIIEAWAAGKPVVTTANQGASEYATDGSTALIAAVDDAGGLACRIADLLADHDAAKQLAAAGHEAWQQRFSPDVVMDSWQTCLADAIARGKR